MVSQARLLFEILIPESAEVVGRYGEDFYAGEPAVTLNRIPAPDGEGHAWYIGAALDQAGLAHVLRRALARHDLIGPYGDQPAVELATRVSPSGEQVDYVLNHAREAVTVTWHADGTDLITGCTVAAGESVELKPAEVVVLRRA